MSELRGVRVVVTRAAHQAEELAAPLRERGARVILFPVIGIAPPEDLARLRDAAEKVEQYDWIIFTSANAVDAFATELRVPKASLKPRIAAVGESTREAAEAKGFNIGLMPRQYVAESLLESLAGEDLHKRRVLIPRAAAARDLIPDELRRRGAHVDVVDAYRNVMPEGAVEQAALVFREPLPEWMTVASPSAVHNLVKLVGAEQLGRLNMASIGPVTSAALSKHGVTADAEASPHTVDGLVEALCAACVMIRKGR